MRLICPRCKTWYYVGSGYAVPMCDCPEVQEDKRIIVCGEQRQ